MVERLMCIVRFATCVTACVGASGCDRMPPAAPNAAVRSLLGDACTLLAASDEETIVAIWPRVQEAVAAMIKSGSDEQSFAWFSRHPIEATLVVCNADGEVSQRVLRNVHARARTGETAYAELLSREREALCSFGVTLVSTATTQPIPWSATEQGDWRAQCLALFQEPDASIAPGSRRDLAAVGGGSNGPQAPRAQRAKASVRADARHQASTPGCGKLHVLTQYRPRMLTLKLNAGEWVEYGNALAACGPTWRPWEALRFPPGQGRFQFVRDYVSPFYNGDWAFQNTFAKKAPEQYKRIAQDYGLDGG